MTSGRWSARSPRCSRSTRSRKGVTRWSAIGTRRIRVNAWLPDDPYPIADVDDWPDDDPDPADLADAVAAAHERVRATLALAARLSRRTGRTVGHRASPTTRSLPRITSAAIAPIGPADRYPIAGRAGPDGAAHRPRRDPRRRRRHVEVPPFVIETWPCPTTTIRLHRRRKKLDDTSIPELIEFVRAYVKQETLDPLRGVGRWIAFGAAGAFLPRTRPGDRAHRRVAPRRRGMASLRDRVLVLGGVPDHVARRRRTARA